MAYKIIKEIKVVGEKDFILQQGDIVTLNVKGVEEINYTVPQGRTGNIKITLEGRLDDQ